MQVWRVSIPGFLGSVDDFMSEVRREGEVPLNSLSRASLYRPAPLAVARPRLLTTKTAVFALTVLLISLTRSAMPIKGESCVELA